MSDEPRDDGYDDFLDAVEEGDPYYLEGSDGAGWLPPRLRDPRTGERGLTEEEMPDTGEIVTMTTTYVATPDFADDAPFVVAIADFGPLQLTGQVRGVDPDDVDIGDEVELDVGRTETADERLVTFHPV